MEHSIGPKAEDICLEDEGLEGRIEEGALEPSLIFFTRRPDTAQIHMQPGQDIAQCSLGMG